MEKYKFGKTRYLVSKIGLGTVQFGLDYGFTKKKSQEEVNEILSCAVKNGINFVDTAREYADSEKKIGNFISENKNDLIIATKLKKISQDEPLDYEHIKKATYKSIENSLRDLKLQKLDMVQLHQTNDYLISNPDFWLVIEKLKTEKIIEAFGVSVYDETETKNLIEKHANLIDFFQIPYNIFDQRFADLESLLRQKSIGIISRSTYLKGVIPCSLYKMPKCLHRLNPYKIRLSEIAST